MENELLDLDFTVQKNFDFFEYRYTMTENRKQQFLEDCQKVLESAHATLQETLKLGVRLAILKEGSEWGGVVDPESGETFYYSSFEKFCKYAFGFGKTKTSNLLSMAEFVEIDENDSLVYKQEKYRRMNMSKLIELAPLSEWVRDYFTAEMTVAEMRMCKRYASSGQFYIDKEKEDFDILACAQRWTDNLKQIEEQKVVDSITEELKRTESSADEPLYLPIEEMEEISMSEFSEEKSRFSTREEVRKFLAKYQEWQYIGYDGFFQKIYRYRFKNGIELYAATCKMCVNVIERNDKELLFFYLSIGSEFQPIKISKYKLEIWLRANEGKL